MPMRSHADRVAYEVLKNQMLKRSVMRLIQALPYILVCFSLTAKSQDSSPSIWEQMQSKSISVDLVKIESLQVTGREIIIGYKVNGISQLGSLCRDIRNEPFFGVVYDNQRAEILREALRNGTHVQLHFRGPWTPCLESVTVAKDQTGY